MRVVEKHNDDDDDIVQLPVRLQSTIEQHKGPVHVARFNSTGRYVLTGGADRTIRLFNATTSHNDNDNDDDGPTAIKLYDAHVGTVLALTVADDNATFASGGEERNVCVWDVESGQVIRRLSSHAGTAHTVMFCGDKSDVLAVGGFDCALRFFDMRAKGAWRPIMECKEAKDALLCSAFSQTYVWTGSVDGVVRGYDVRAGQMHEDVFDRPITSLTPSALGKTLLVTTLASSQATAKATHTILDTADGAHLCTIEGGRNTQYRCRSTFWSNDEMVIAGDEDGAVCAWNVMNGKTVHRWSHTMQNKASAVLWSEASPSRERRRFVTAGADGKVRIWSCE